MNGGNFGIAVAVVDGAFILVDNRCCWRIECLLITLMVDNVYNSVAGDVD